MKRFFFILFISITVPRPFLRASDRDPLVIRHADRFEYLDRDGVKVQRLIGHVEIYYKDFRIYSDTAIHYHTLDKMEFNGRARLDYENQSMSADRILYFKKDSSAQAFGNVCLFDKERKVRITGGKGDYSRRSTESRIWVKPVLVKADTGHGDTLTITARMMRHFGREKKAVAEDSVTMTQGGIRAVCRRAEYDQDGEILRLLKDPRVFYERNTLKGDTIVLVFKDEKIDQLHVFGHAAGRFLDENHAHPDSEKVTVLTGDTLIGHLVESRIRRMEVLRHAIGLNYFKSDTLHVNHLTGKYMEFFFFNNAVDSTHVFGNAGSVYYSEEKEGPGRNETSGDTLRIYFLDKQVNRIDAYGGVKGVYCRRPEK